ncbi:MAG: polyprenyl synthetase family protein [Crocinitomicaceae bacterium]
MEAANKIDLNTYKEIIENYLDEYSLRNFPENLSDSAHHIMTLDGKRLRPMMVLMSYLCYDENYKKALNAAIAIEVFHNFTLVHDDIMDNAKLRRGKSTVHELFGVNKAIVTGDAMLPHSYSLLQQDNEDKAADLLTCFTKMAIEVMEGQQFDMNFETSETTTVAEYMEMIKLKTSVLFGASMQIGAIIAGASKKDQEHLYNFGLYTGLAFQIMDDYLDTFGDHTFGKKIGGDILLNKKTFLLVNAIEKADSTTTAEIKKLFNETNEDKKIAEFQALFTRLNLPEICISTMEELHQKANDNLMSTSIPQERKEQLQFLGDVMLKRKK